MAEVLAPSIPPRATAHDDDSIQEYSARPRPRSHLSSSNSIHSTARLSTLSRPHSSSVFPAFPSTLAYANVRDFAYPAFHPLHYGTPAESLSGTTTPGSEWASSRRLSDPLEAWNSGRGGNWGAGPWGGDGILYADPAGDDGEALPSTSFGDEDDRAQPRKGKHSKSRSYTEFSDLERGRRQDSSLSRRSRASGDGNEGVSKLDPAGQDSLRLSRSYGKTGSKRGTNTLPSRSFHTGQSPATAHDEDLLPLDAEQSAHALSPQRASMGPEDEELYAGESLALYSFEPENPNELRLREGQIILVSYRHGQGWLVAEDPESGEQGLVPEEYVRLVREIESWDPERGGFIEDESVTVDVTTDEVETPVNAKDYQEGFQTQESHQHAEKTSELLEGRQDSAHGESKP